MTAREELTDREREILQLLADGAADKEIAAQLHLSLNTVKWHNRQLYTKLGVTNRAQAVKTAEKLGLLGEAEEQLKPGSRIPNNLPAPVSSFVGREKEIQEIIDLLQDHRLVTLTGPGGVGKTRLALELCRELIDKGRFSDGIFLIELASVTVAELAGRVIVEGLELSPPPGEEPSETLIRFLGDRKILLVLDNFEHLLGSSKLVSVLLAEVPDLKILCTSRETLHLSGEQLYPVQPLDDLSSRELFVQRAQEGNPGFDPKVDEFQIIDRICSRLDCLPLAVELAASRVILFSLVGLLNGLEDRFRFFANTRWDIPERHQTLRAAIDWSIGLLEEEERVLFRRLAVFQGSRTIDAVQKVCCFDLELDAMLGLESLLLKNLIRQEEGLDGEVRFYLLETIHEYARGMLLTSGEEADLSKRHAEYFVELVQSFSRKIKQNRDVVYWYQKIEGDFSNIRRAQHWTSDQGMYDLKLMLNEGLRGFWGMMSHHQEGKEWIDSCLEFIGNASIHLQAGIYLAAADIYLIFYDYDRSQKFYENALDLYQTIGDKHAVGVCHLGLANLVARGGYFEEDQVLEHFKAGVELFTEVKDASALSSAWGILGLYYDLAKNEELAYQARKKSLDLARESGDDIQVWSALYFLAISELRLGNPNKSKELFLECLQGESTHLRFHCNIEGTFEASAAPELALGNPQRAVTLLSVGALIREKKGGILASDFHKQLTASILDQVKGQLDQISFEQAWKQGQTMNFEEAVNFALAERVI